MKLSLGCWARQRYQYLPRMSGFAPFAVSEMQFRVGCDCLFRYACSECDRLHVNR